MPMIREEIEVKDFDVPKQESAAHGSGQRECLSLSKKPENENGNAIRGISFT